MSAALPLIGFFGWAWAAKEDSASDKGAGNRVSWTIPLVPSRAQQGELARGAHGLMPLLLRGHGLRGVTGMTACLSQLGLPGFNNKNLFSHSSGGKKSKNKMSAVLVLSVEALRKNLFTMASFLAFNGCWKLSIFLSLWTFQCLLPH